MEAAHRLEHAVDEGDDRRRAVDLPVAELQLGALHALDAVGVDALVDDQRPLAERDRKGAGLEGRRANDAVGIGVGHAHDRILGVDPERFGDAEFLELGVEADIAAGRAVVEFAAQDLPRLGEDLLHEGGLAPGRVADDEVGLEPVLLQFQRALRGGAAADQVRLGPYRQIEDAGGRRAVALPHQQRNAVRLPPALRDRDALVPGGLQRRQQEFETAGEVVVDEKNFGHSGI
jgi:hypothetical protein